MHGSKRVERGDGGRGGRRDDIRATSTISAPATVGVRGVRMRMRVGRARDAARLARGGALRACRAALHVRQEAHPARE